MSIKTLLFAVGALALAACDHPTEPPLADTDAKKDGARALAANHVPYWTSCQGADLNPFEDISDWVTPWTVMPGQSVQVKALSVQNSGTVASNWFSSGYYLSDDAEITPADRLLSVTPFTTLEPGHWLVYPARTLTIPANVLPDPLHEFRAFYVGLLVDRRNTTRECNERNNFMSESVIVGAH